MSAPLSRILITLPVPAEPLAQARAKFPQYEWVEARKERVAELAAEAEIICGPPRAEHASAAPKLKWFQSTSAGAEQVAGTPAFKEGRILLTTAAGMHDSCAEHALALLLALTRQTCLYARTEMAAGTGAGSAENVRGYSPSIWDLRKVHPSPRVLNGQSLGLLGLGAIGRAIARITKTLGLTVIGVSYHGQPVPECHETHAIARLDDLLPRFDVLILALPASPNTDGLLSAARLKKLPRHALVVNVGRGNALDEAALVQALRDGTIAGAGLDVFAKEPLPADSLLYTLPNVVLTPHIGGNRPDYHERAFEIFLDNLERYSKGEALLNLVERERGY